MYTRQQPAFEAHTQLPRDVMQVVDDVSGPLYHQRPVPVNATFSTQAPIPAQQSILNDNNSNINDDINSNNNNNNNGYLQTSQPYFHQSSQVPAEPTPSSTEVPTTPLTIEQLAEFVSTMIYLLWHVRRSSVMVLHSASSKGDYPALFVNQGDTASMMNGTNTGFQMFCQQVLTATQLSEQVVMLSLKYIAKLLQSNPHIQGAEGSEYRLFIVALLLANKFHDDNTFTNRTWSAVSGMKVEELDIMELEFLDVLDFQLFVRKEEFDRWKAGLLTFMLQLQSATRVQEQQNHQQMIDSTLRSMGLYLPTAPDPTWNASTNNIMAQQQQQQYLYLLSTAQPSFPTQPLNAPLTRVPLRIPAYPVYLSTTATTTTIPSDSAATVSVSVPSASIPSTSVSTTSAALPMLSTSSSSSSISSATSSNHATPHLCPTSQQQHQEQEQQQQQQHNLEYGTLMTSQSHMPLTYPAPARTTNRVTPRNSSTPSLATLSQNNSIAANARLSDQQRACHYHRGFQPYQRRTVHIDDQQPLVDYYAWKTLTEGNRINNTLQAQHCDTEKDPLLPQSLYEQQQQQYHGASRLRAHSSPSPSFYHHHHHQQQQQQQQQRQQNQQHRQNQQNQQNQQQQQQQQQQLLQSKPYQSRQPHDIIYQGYSPNHQQYQQPQQQTAADPSYSQYDHQQPYLPYP